MPDNVNLNSGDGLGAVVATDQDGTNAHHQYIKVEYGPDDTQSKVTATNGLPIQGDGHTLPVLETNSTDILAAAAALVVLANAIKTAVEVIDNSISGTETRVSVVVPIPAGTNNIGDVDVVSLPSDVAVVSGAAAGKGVLTQAMYGAVRQNVKCDILGHLQVDIAEQSDTTPLNCKLAANDGVDVGNVDVASLPADVAVAEAGALGKGVLLQADDGTDRHNVACDEQGRVLVVAGSSGTIGRARINASLSGDNTLVAAQGPGNKIRVLEVALNVNGEVVLNFENGASSGTYLSGPWYFGGANQAPGMVLQYSPVGHFETTADTLLNLELSAAVAVTGHIVYEVVT